jgi:hypothetical protein
MQKYYGVMTLTAEMGVNQSLLRRTDEQDMSREILEYIIEDLTTVKRLKNIEL